MNCKWSSLYWAMNYAFFDDRTISPFKADNKLVKYSVKSLKSLPTSDTKLNSTGRLAICLDVYLFTFMIIYMHLALARSLGWPLSFR